MASLKNKIDNFIIILLSILPLALASGPAIIEIIVFLIIVLFFFSTRTIKFEKIDAFILFLYFFLVLSSFFSDFKIHSLSSSVLLIRFILLYFLVSCAQQTPLTGGQKDVTPPQLDSLRTHPSSLATFFNEKEVELVFNENIQVGNGKRDLITSPTIYQLETNVVKNKLIIKWKDSLSINTTYQLYFPNSIADLTEKNTLSNFKFVFSTGDKIENGKYEGEIIEMPHDQKGEGYLVHLKHVSDTLLNYKTYSNKDGVFEFDFIQPGHYLIGGFNDENNNFELDSVFTIGFSTTHIRKSAYC